MEVSKSKKNLLWIITCAFWFCQYSFVPYMSDNLKAVGATSFMIGLVAGAYGLVQLLMRIPFGIVADITKKHKLFVIGGMFFNCISPLLMAFATDPVHFMILRGLSGLAASTWVSYTVLYSSYYKKEELNLSISNINTSNNLGRFLAFSLGAFAAQYFGIKAPFYLCGIIGFIGLILTFFVFETKIEIPPVKVSELIKVAYNKQLLVASFLCVLSQFIVFGTAMSFVSDYAKSIGAGGAELGLLTAAFTLPMILGAHLSGRPSLLKFGVKKLMLGGFAAIGLYCLLIPLVHNVYFLYPVQLIGGFGNGFAFTLLMSYSIGDVDPQKKSTAMGIFQSIYSLGMTFGPMLMGSILEATGFMTGFWCMTGVSCIAIMTIVMFVKNRK